MSLNAAPMNDLIYRTRSTKSNIFQKLNELLKPKYDKKTIGNKPVIEVKFVEKIDNLVSTNFLKNISTE